MGILPEKEREGEGEREREEVDTGGARFPRNPSSRSWSEKLVHPLLSGKAFDTFDCTYRSMANTILCSVSSPDSYRDQAFSLHT